MPMTPDEREDAKFQLEQKRFALDERRVALEESKAQNDNLFLNRKFPAMVTAIVSITALFVSGVQWWTSTKQRDQEQKALDAKNSQELALSTVKTDQEFKLKAATFIADNSEKIFGGTDEERLRIRNVILASFPAEISKALFANLEQSAQSPQAAATWSEGQKVSSALAAKQGNSTLESPRVFLHYKNKADKGMVDFLANRLVSLGYRVPGSQLVVQDTRGDIRFYHTEDAPEAGKVETAVESFLKENGRNIALRQIDLSKQYPNVPKGVIEVWIP